MQRGRSICTGRAEAVFEWLKKAGASGVTSTLTMLEVLVQPYRDSDEEGVDWYYSILSTYPHLSWIEPSLAISDRAAQLTADFNFRTPDAIQAATAQIAGASGITTNDPLFRRVQDLDVLILDDLRNVAE